MVVTHGTALPATFGLILVTLALSLEMSGLCCLRAEAVSELVSGRSEMRPSAGPGVIKVCAWLVTTPVCAHTPAGRPHTSRGARPGASSPARWPLLRPLVTGAESLPSAPSGK